MRWRPATGRWRSSRLGRRRMPPWRRSCSGRASLAMRSTAYECALALNPGLATLHTEIGNVLRLQGRFEEAIAAHQRTIARSPTAPRPTATSVVTLQTLGRDAEAVDGLSRGHCALAPDYAEAHSQPGRPARRPMGKSDGGHRRVPRRRSTLDPELAPRSLQSGRHAQGRWSGCEEAIGAYRQALACEPEPDAGPFRALRCAAARVRLARPRAGERRLPASRRGQAMSGVAVPDRWR